MGRVGQEVEGEEEAGRMRSLDDMGQDGHHQEHLSAAAHLSVSVWLAASVCAACGMVLCALNARLASQTQIWSALVSVLEALPSVSPGCAVRRIGDWCHGMSMYGGTCPLGRPFSPARQPREHEVVGCIVYMPVRCGLVANSKSQCTVDACHPGPRPL
uniref:Uncharacterized protein n=1 Tax=Haptolina ericina TaxID=156174 RepID=A0A6T9EUZ2_9EUKA